jgi:transposase
VKREQLDWLADNPLYTKRFAFFVGRRCRETTVKEVADDLFLDWHTVKELDKQYMRAQLRRAGQPAPRVLGIDEIAVAKGHQYRIVVSDLERGRPIWFGGQDRSEASLDQFFAWLGPAKCRKIRLVVMDMWQPFRNATLKEGNAPQATILYDKFHILMHLGEAMDKVRKPGRTHYRPPTLVPDPCFRQVYRGRILLRRSPVVTEEKTRCLRPDCPFRVTSPLSRTRAAATAVYTGCWTSLSSPFVR